MEWRGRKKCLRRRGAATQPDTLLESKKGTLSREAWGKGEKNYLKRIKGKGKGGKSPKG